MFIDEIPDKLISYVPDKIPFKIVHIITNETPQPFMLFTTVYFLKLKVSVSTFRWTCVNCKVKYFTEHFWRENDL